MKGLSAAKQESNAGVGQACTMGGSGRRCRGLSRGAERTVEGLLWRGLVPTWVGMFTALHLPNPIADFSIGRRFAYFARCPLTALAEPSLLGAGVLGCACHGGGGDVSAADGALYREQGGQGERARARRIGTGLVASQDWPRQLHSGPLSPRTLPPPHPRHPPIKAQRRVPLHPPRSRSVVSVWQAAESAGPRTQASTFCPTWLTPATWAPGPEAACWVEATPGPATADAWALRPPIAWEMAEDGAWARRRPAGGAQEGLGEFCVSR